MLGQQYCKKNMIEKKESFEKMENKLLNKKGRGDCIIISESENKCGARIYSSDVQRIKNAFILVEKAGEREIWRIKQGRIQQCPEPFYFLVRDYDKVWACIGERQLEESYYIFKDMENEPSENVFILGVVEAQEYTVGFYYNWKSKLNNYLLV